MTPQKQKFRHNPPETFGDCASACLASLLDLPVEAVPHFSKLFWEDRDGWSRAEKEFLASKGLRKVQFGYSCSLENVLDYMKASNPDVYYVLLGTSRNGTAHDVVGLNDQIIHDPSVDNSGIVSPCEPEGAYYISVFVPMAMTWSEEKI